jgi:hypothetical protein
MLLVWIFGAGPCQLEYLEALTTRAYDVLDALLSALFQPRSRKNMLNDSTQTGNFL